MKAIYFLAFALVISLGATQKSGDLTLPALSFDIEKVFTINYEFKPAGFITMAIKYKLPGQYFSLGFGNSGMINADIWTFELANNEVVVSDQYSSEYGAPPKDIEVGGTEDVERLGYEITPTYTLVKVRRALNTGDSKDLVITQGLNAGMWASGPSPTLEYHGETKGVLTFPFQAPGASSNHGSVLLENKRGKDFK